MVHWLMIAYGIKHNFQRQTQMPVKSSLKKEVSYRNMDRHEQTTITATQEGHKTEIRYEFI